MKKYYISRPILSIMLCITFFLNLLTGCTDSETPRHLAIVYAACQNNPVPMMNGQLYETISDTAGIFDSTMSVFVADQSCYRAYYRRFESPNMTLSEAKRKQIIRGYTADALSAIGKATAQADDVDLIGCITQASRQLLTDKKDDELADMLIIASGLSTVYPLDFTNGYLFCEPEDVVDALKEKQALPDLSFVDSITWIGCGDVTEPQKKLSYAQVDRLKNIWKAVLEECGCKKVTFAPDISDNNQRENSGHTVKTVDVGDFVDDDKKIDLKKVHYFADIEGGIKFRAFSTEIVTDLEEVKKILEPYAEELNSHPEESVVLAGMTDHYGTNDMSNMRFSMSRAAAVRKLFIAYFNVNPDQLIICGLGYTDHPWRFRDNTTGEEIKGANRAVIIVGTDTEAAETFLRIGVRE